MNIIVVGCGRLGAELAYRMDKNKHRVTVIDQKRQAFTDLPDDFSGRVVEGDAMNEAVLARAGIATIDGLAAVTSSDTVNAVVAHIANTVYEVPNVAVRNYDSRYRALHESFGNQLVSSTSWGAQRVEELLYHAESHSVFSAGNGEVEIYEFHINDEWNGRLLKDLLPAQGCVPAAVTRAGKALLPEADTTLLADDVLLVSATFEGSMALREKISRRTTRQRIPSGKAG